MKRRYIFTTTASLIFAINCMGNPLDNATYSQLFDRASGLIPGETKVDHDLTETGEWEFDGACGIKAGDKLSIEAQNDKFEMTWKIWEGGFKRVFPMRLRLQVEDDDAGAPGGAQPLTLFKIYPTDTPLRVLPYVFTRDRFNSLEDEKKIIPGERKSGSLTFKLPAREFGGFKLAFEGLDGKSLAGKTFAIKNIRLEGEYVTGCFRREIELPAGEIWEAVAEVDNTTILYVNGQRVDDKSIVMPRPIPAGPAMYQSRRVPLKSYLQSGRNVLGMYSLQTGRQMSYLRGSVIMDSGERILLDSDTNWIWSSEAPADWTTSDYTPDDWKEIRELSWGDWLKERSAARPSSFLGGLKSNTRGSMPCYDGFIKLRNPLDSKFYFNENTPFQLDVLIPPGFQDKQPELAWELNRYSSGGSFAEMARGSVKNFEMKKDSLFGLINSENIKRGIYVLTARLMLEGEIIEEREPEPMVVTGKVKMEKSAGDSWEEGLELSLEKIIDFTDPDDPHPWLEIDACGPRPGGSAFGSWGEQFYAAMDEPLIVERNGLKYRETRPVSWAQFSYHVEFANPGDWYLLVMEYPDDTERWIGVTCNADSRTPEPNPQHKPETQWAPCSKAGPVIWTGGKYPNSGKMLEMKWLYRPDPGPHAINVMSLMHDSAAAAARLRVYHIQGRLSELDAGDIPVRDQRRFGMLTERTFPWVNGIYNTFSSFAREEMPGPRSDTGAGILDDNAVREACAYLYLLEDAASHYAEYMRFAGQNLHVMGCYQYHDGNTASQYLTGAPRIHDSSENMLARVLQANDLMFHASVEFTSNSRRYPPGGRAVTDQDYYFADRTGKKPAVQSRGFTPGMNFMHPAIEGDMLEVARQLAEKFKHQPNFLGINWMTLFGVHGGAYLPSYSARGRDAKPLDLGYDDFTIGLFENETGIKVPGGKGEANKYEQRYQFLTSPEIKPVWIAWRARKLVGFFVKLSNTVRAVRPDLECVAGTYLTGDFYEEWKSRGVDLHEYISQWGWNPDEFSDKDGIWLMPWLNAATRYRSGHHFTANHALEWQWFQEPEFYRQFAGLDRRALMLYIGWIEVQGVAANYPYRENWPRPMMQRLMGQQREEMAMEPYTQGMIGMDPQMVMMGFTDGVPYIGVEGMQRRFTRVLRRLPQDRLEPVLDTGFDSNLAIRALHDGNELLFYVANPGYWPIKGAVTLAGAERVVDLVSGKTMALENGVMDVELEPFGIAAFLATSDAAPDKSQIKDHRSKIHIIAWTTDPLPESELAHIRGLLVKARESADDPGMAGFLEPDDYAILKKGLTKAEQAMAECHYAAAWSALTDGTFWTVLFQKADKIKFADTVNPRLMSAINWGSGLAPKIDGALTDRVWADYYAKPFGYFVTSDNKYSETRTFVRALRTGDRLFFAFELIDPAPDKIHGMVDPTNQSSIWSSRADMAVLMIMPPNTKNCFQFAVDASGTISSRKIVKDGVDYSFTPDWRAEVGRFDSGWTIEMELDVKELFGVSPRNGDEWQINFYRRFRTDKTPDSSWTYTPDLDSMEHMGVVRFVSHRP